MDYPRRLNLIVTIVASVLLVAQWVTSDQVRPWVSGALAVVLGVQYGVAVTAVFLNRTDRVLRGFGWGIIAAGVAFPVLIVLTGATLAWLLLPVAGGVTFLIYFRRARRNATPAAPVADPVTGEILDVTV